MLGFRHALGVAAVLLSVQAAALRAESAAERLGEVLLLSDVAEQLRDEGIAYGERLDEEMLDGRGGAHFAGEVSRIYNSAALLMVMQKAIAEGLDAAQVNDSLAFFDTELGGRILTLELSARRAISDPAVEDMAADTYDSASAEGNPRVDDIVAFIEANDLSERNVAEALSSNYQFFLGLSSAAGAPASEAEIIDRVWSQEEDIRESTTEWLQNFLFMAYGPLSDDELHAYIAFSQSSAGRALNAALFDGFEEMYRAVYYALGLSVGRALSTSDL